MDALADHDTMVIQQRGGWADLSMVQMYVESADLVGMGSHGVPFPPKPLGMVSELRRDCGLESSGGRGVWFN